jgi:hypothetical protein
MIGKHLILEILEIKKRIIQEEPESSYVKSLIQKPLQELYKERETLVMQLEGHAYPEFYDFY